MKRIFRSKLFISIILLILCFFLIFVLLPKNYEAQNQTIQVVQFIDDVELGAKITSSMLTTKTIGKYGVDSRVITSKDDIIGKYAAYPIRHSTNLYNDMFTDEWTDVEGVIDTLLQPGDKLVTISLGNGAKSVGGQIHTGSIVDVLTREEQEAEYDEYGYPVDAGEPKMELTVLLKRVMVYKVQNNALEDISELRRQWISLVDAGNKNDAEFDASLTPAYVTLIVTEEQAIALANQEYGGEVHLVLYPEVTANMDPEPEVEPTPAPEVEPSTQPEVDLELENGTN